MVNQSIGSGNFSSNKSTDQTAILIFSFSTAEDPRPAYPNVIKYGSNLSGVPSVKHDRPNSDNIGFSDPRPMGETKRFTKIIATYGPSSESAVVTGELIEAGVDVFRLNASHRADKVTISGYVDTIRQESARIGKTTGIFLDLQGPKIRIGKFTDGKIELPTGAKFAVTTRDLPGTEDIVSVSYEGFVRDLHVGSLFFIDDGKVRLKVVSKTTDTVHCEVIQGGVLSNNKGLNLPETKVGLSAISEKDRIDTKTAVELELDYVALSFVSTADDVVELRQLLDSFGGHQIKIIAKIERQLAIDHIISIIEAADAVMVARGDLGVEIGIENVPKAQKMIITECNRRMKPVIVATQMLESMITSRNATRAEVSDVANAIYDRCDAVMLSGETAVGIDPANVVRVMANICLATDQDVAYIKKHSEVVTREYFIHKTMTSSICEAADWIAEENDAHALLVFSSSGNTPLIASKLQSSRPIIAPTDNEIVLRRMSLYRGVFPIMMPKKFSKITLWMDMITLAIAAGKERNMLANDDTLVVTAGVPIGQSNGTNSVRVVKA